MEDVIATVRSFNRFFTQSVGALDPDFLGTGLTLAEARLLFEIAHSTSSLAVDLKTRLDMDAGYVSRLLRRFTERGWIVRGRGSDTRQRPIALTKAGRKAFAIVDQRQRDEVSAVLVRLPATQQTQLAAALHAAQALVSGPPPRTFSGRTFKAGDMGMIAARQSILYREVYGWGPQIEVIEGEVTTAFLRDFKPGREQCWVAEVDRAMVGSVFLTDEGGGLSRLRLLYVEPSARGLGIGNTLVTTCIDFARGVGYQAMTLWTHTILESARRIYAAHGFRIVESHTHEAFGQPVESETWQLDLKAA